jgi:hypothetical protein
MTWRKHFRMVKMPGVQQPKASGGGGGTGSGSKYSSYLPEVYAGHPNRVQRYFQYEDMDRDSEINSALDTIADFCTQSEEQNDQPFYIHYNEDANATEVKLIHTCLQKWTKMNNFRSRLYTTFRNVIKNGDQFFLRDPETKEWLWIDHFDVELVRVDEGSGKEPMEYVIRNLDYGKQDKFATKPADPNEYNTPAGSATSPFSRTSSTGGGGGNMFTLPGQGSDPRFGNATVPKSHVVDAKHVVHLSLSTGMDSNWPFGASVLEPVFKTFKQKELLEDAVIIYRVQRAPERRIFYIDVGNMPPVLANAHVERIKNDIHQRRIPNRTGGGNSIMDAAYNPLTMMEDYFFAQSAEGRGSKVETLAGGEQLGEIADLEFFNKKLRAGLRIPSSYLPGGEDNGQVAYNDGKMGAAMIQEFRFNKYCMRLQSLLAPVFDKEFKQFLKDNGIQIEESLFELFFNPPQNFTKYRQIELDSAQMNVYSQIADNKKLSERFKFKRFLNLTEEEMLENERMWAEENPAKMRGAVGKTAADDSPGDGLSSVGVSSGGGGLGGDLGMDDMGGNDAGDTGGDDAGGDAGGDLGSDIDSALGGGDTGGDNGTE